MELNDEIAAAASRAAAMFESRNGTELELTEASLIQIEELLAEAADYADGMSSDQIDRLAQDFGCYILEVGRREFGGRYLWHNDRDQPVLVVGEPNYRIAMIAWDKVRGRIGGDEGDNIPFFYAGFAARARKALPGDDALYV